MTRRTAVKTNAPIRDAMQRAGIVTWQLADLLGVHENTVFRMLRHELSQEEQQRIVTLIKTKAVAN